MVKSLKKGNLKKRTVKRSKRGGEIINSLAQIKTNNNFILGEIARIESNGDCDFSQIKEIAEEEKKVIENEIDEQLAKQEKEQMQMQEKEKEKEQDQKKELEQDVEAAGVSSPLVVNEERKEVPIMQQMITINGFTGTVGELLSRMREKVIQLKKNAGDKYKVTIDKLTAVAKKISSDTIENVDKIKQILKDEQVTFKNNKLFGGKTKKRHNNKKSNRKTKRR
jgi:hypothetical protein